jgi:hypothetical protein
VLNTLADIDKSFADDVSACHAERLMQKLNHDSTIGPVSWEQVCSALSRDGDVVGPDSGVWIASLSGHHVFVLGSSRSSKINIRGAVATEVGNASNMLLGDPMRSLPVRQRALSWKDVASIMTTAGVPAETAYRALVIHCRRQDRRW